MDKYYKKGSRDFVVRFCERERKVFVGTSGFLSNLAAQMISHEVMAPLKWQPTQTFVDLTNKDGSTCTAVGYNVPFSANAQKQVSALFD